MKNANMFEFAGAATVNPLYNDIRYNSKNRYNVCAIISGSCSFSLIFPSYSSGKHTFCLFFRTEAILKNTQNI